MQSKGRFARLLRWLVIPVIIAGVATQAAPPVRAADNSTKNGLQDKLNSIQADRAEVSGKLDAATQKASAAQTQLDQATQQAKDADAQVQSLKNQMASTQKDLDTIQANLKKTQDRYNKTQAALALRVRSLDEEGRVSYLAVLFGSSSFADFIGRLEMLKLVVQQDSKLITQVRQDKQSLVDQQTQATTRMNQLSLLKAQADSQKQVADARRSDMEQISRSLEGAKRDLAAQLDADDQQAAAVRAQIDALMAQANRPSNGAFNPIWPVQKPYIITDPYGPRMHPILHVERMHYGTDLNAPMGSPIYAIESGVVVESHWDDAYGNLIVIDHGGGYSSWYGHNSQSLVSVGDHVTQGQVIARAGSTGWSTGAHCHLEIHVNGKAVNPMSFYDTTGVPVME
ncbi:MAG: murein hydrolase activator EnvC family protein [Mycobacterium leprae]